MSLRREPPQASAAPRRAVVVDFHTMHGIPDVGRDFDAEHFAGTLAEAGVNLAILPARCNRGFTYFPSQAGTVHPSLKFDLFGQMVEGCRRRGIRACAYFHAGLDHEHLLRHREWCRVDASGRVYDLETRGHYFRKPCLNTGYGDYLLATIAEVLARYPVDDLFLDGFDIQSECHGFECLDAMKKLGLDPLSSGDRLKFSEKTALDFAKRVRNLACGCGRDIGSFFNGLSFGSQSSWVAIEVLPGLGWGYDYLPAALRHVRETGRNFFVLTSRFQHGFGDFGGLPPEHSIRFDCLNALANGGGVGVIDCLHPRGCPEKAVYDLMGRIFSEIRTLEAWTEGSSVVAEMAIVDPAVSRARAAGQDDYPRHIRGAARMLMELKCQFDVVSGRGDLSLYRVLILPDEVQVDAALGEVLHAHLERGGVIISSGASLLGPRHGGVVLPGCAWRFLGPEASHPGYFVVRPEFASDLPEMPVGIYSPGIAMSAEEGSVVIADFVQPYSNEGEWDGFHEIMYAPPDSVTGRPAAVRSGNLVHLSFPIFSGYFSFGVIHYRTLLRNILREIVSDPIVIADNAPSFVQLTVADAPRWRLVHVLAYAPELRGEKVIVEEPLVVTDLRLKVKMDGEPLQAVYLAPSREPLPFVQCGEYVEIVLTKVKGYQLVIFERAGGV
jgi:hypothetical protein